MAAPPPDTDAVEIITGSTEGHDSDVDEAAMEQVEAELLALPFENLEPVPSRDFDYPVVAWDTPTEPRPRRASTPSGRLELHGEPAPSVARERPPQQPRKKSVVTKVPKNDPPISLDFDIASPEVDEKWLDLVRRIHQSVEEGEEQMRDVAEGIARLRELCAQEIPSTPPVVHDDHHEQLLTAPVDNTEELVMEEFFSEDEEAERALPEDTRKMLEEEFAREEEERRKREEEQRSRTLAAAEEEFAERILKPEKKLEDLRNVAECDVIVSDPHILLSEPSDNMPQPCPTAVHRHDDLPPAEAVKEESVEGGPPAVHQPLPAPVPKATLRMKRVQQAQEIAAKEAMLEVALVELQQQYETKLRAAAEELRKRQETMSQRRREKAEAQRQQEEEERRRTEQAQAKAFEFLKKERALERVRERKRREARERVEMEAADLESKHMDAVRREAERRAEAVAAARRAAELAEKELEWARQVQEVEEEERATRMGLEGEEREGRRVPLQGVASIMAMVQAHSNQRRALCNSDEPAKRRVIDREWDDELTTLVNTFRARLGAFREACLLFVCKEEAARGVIVASEVRAFGELTATASRRGAAKAAAARKADALGRAKASTAAGVTRLEGLLTAVVEEMRDKGRGHPAPHALQRAQGLALQQALRDDWQGFFDYGAFEETRRRKAFAAAGVKAGSRILRRPYDFTVLGNSSSTPSSPSHAAGHSDEAVKPSSAPALFPAEELGQSTPATPSESSTARMLDLITSLYPGVPHSQLRSVCLSYESIEGALSADLTPLRGLLELDLTGNAISSISGLGELPNLQSLKLQDNQLTNLSSLQALSHAEALRYLDVDNNRISNTSALSVCSQLRSVTLRRNCVGEVGSIRGCGLLVELDVFRNNIADLSFLNDLPGLTSINAGRNAVTEITGALRACPLLREVQLDGNRISMIPNRFHNVLLQELWLGDNKLEKVPDLCHLPLLRVLDLSNNSISEPGGVAGCLHLEHLDLSFNALSDPAAVLACLQHLHRLSRLSLNDNPLWEAGSSPPWKAVLVGILPAVKELNSEVVTHKERELAEAGTLPSLVAGEMVLAALRGGVPCLQRPATLVPLPMWGRLVRSAVPWEHAVYDHHVAHQNRELQEIDVRYADAMHWAKSAAQGRRLGVLSQCDVRSEKLQVLDDVLPGFVKAHATPGTAHMAHQWYASRRYQHRLLKHRRTNAGAVLTRWARHMLAKLRDRRHAEEVLKKYDAAARRIQPLWRGAWTRLRLRENRWVDDDPTVYGKVEVDFAAPMPSAGEVLADALRRAGAPDLPVSQLFTLAPTPQPPAPRAPPDPARPRGPAHPPQPPQPLSPPHPTSPPQPPPPPSPPTVQDAENMAWAAGMQRRDKKFEMIRKRRMQQERMYDPEKRLEAQMRMVQKHIQSRASTSSTVQSAPVPLPSSPAVERDLELQSMGSTVSSQATAATVGVEPLRKSGSLPPLGAKGKPSLQKRKSGK
eukprot:Sspe_Gene.22718::Locus_8688_Transcript_1_1_Confidence_1.000_Length_4798::g.22718::m.22718